MALGSIFCLQPYWVIGQPVTAVDVNKTQSIQDWRIVIGQPAGAVDAPEQNTFPQARAWRKYAHTAHARRALRFVPPAAETGKSFLLTSAIPSAVEETEKNYRTTHIMRNDTTCSAARTLRRVLWGDLRPSRAARGGTVPEYVQESFSRSQD